MKKQESKTRTTTTAKNKKVSCQIPKYLDSRIEAASKKLNCDKSVVIRTALYSFFGMQD